MPPIAKKKAKRKRAKRTKAHSKEEYAKQIAERGWQPSIWPSEFAYFVLKERTLYPWQVECLEAIAQGFPVSICANNGSGKTSKVAAISILWFLSEFPKGWVVCTSGSARQLQAQLMPTLRLHAAKFPKWRFLSMGIVTDQGGEAILFSTDDPGRAEGWHPKISNEIDPVFLLCDEAKTVEDKVFEAFDRCTRRFQVYISTPGDAAGQFYRSHRNEKALFWTKQVTSYDCPHIDHAKIQRDELKYGRTDPLFKSMHLAEFDEDSEALVISPASLTAALEDQPVADYEAFGGELIAFCDFAAGSDENVLAVRRGNSVRIIRAWRQTNTVQAVREFIRMFRDEGLHPGQVFGDAGGLGTPMLDQFAEEGFAVRRVHNVSPAKEPENYSNLGSEMWFYFRREMLAGRLNLSDTNSIDPLLFTQLTTRPRARDARQRLRCMPKEEMQKQFSLPSPDRADALCGAVYCGGYYTGAITATTVRQIEMKPSEFRTQTVKF